MRQQRCFHCIHCGQLRDEFSEDGIIWKTVSVHICKGNADLFFAIPLQIVQHWGKEVVHENSDGAGRNK